MEQECNSDRRTNALKYDVVPAPFKPVGGRIGKISLKHGPDGISADEIISTARMLLDEHTDALEELGADTTTGIITL
jgi:hypothetical protein